MAEKVREADAHSPKRWATGRTTSSNQYALGHNVASKRIAAVFVVDDANSSRRGEVDRSMDSQMIITQDTKKTTRKVGLGVGDYVTGIEVEEQVPG